MEKHASLRVLIVDDNPDDFELMSSLLRSIAQRVESERVETAAQMAAALERGPWDAVLVDWLMPQFDAPAALALLRAIPGAPPCIVVSGIPGESVAVTSIKLGAADFVRKDEMQQLPFALERELAFRK